MLCLIKLGLQARWAGIWGLTILLPCSLNRVEGHRGEIQLQNIRGNFFLSITAAVPAALLQYKSHGRPRSSLCLLNTMPSWWLITLVKGTKSQAIYWRHPPVSPAAPRPLSFSTQSTHSGTEWKAAVEERRLWSFWWFLWAGESGKEAVVPESASVCVKEVWGLFQLAAAAPVPADSSWASGTWRCVLSWKKFISEFGLFGPARMGTWPLLQIHLGRTNREM